LADKQVVRTSVEELCDPRLGSRDDSIRTARGLAEERQGYDTEVFRYVSDQLTATKVDLGVIERGIEVLDAIAPRARLHAVLRAALAHEDGRVRSKTAVVVGRMVADLPLLQRLLADSDSRVRANTLEAVWGMKGADIEMIFVRALGESNHRVVANAAYGLYSIDPEKYFPQITGLIDHAGAGHRTAGAWLLGKLGNPDNLPLLKPLLVEKNSEVRGAAFKSLKILRSLSRDNERSPALV
jgi:HEAT repeat protein